MLINLHNSIANGMDWRWPIPISILLQKEHQVLKEGYEQENWLRVAAYYRLLIIESKKYEVPTDFQHWKKHWNSLVLSYKALAKFAHLKIKV